MHLEKAKLFAKEKSNFGYLGISLFIGISFPL